MTKVTINPQPEVSADLPVSEKAPDGSATVTDEKGRKLKLKEPHVLAPFNLVEALGELAENRVLTSMYFPLIYLVAIDAEIISPSADYLQLKALVQTLGNEGMKALRDGVGKYFGKQDASGKVSAIKKS